LEKNHRKVKVKEKHLMKLNLSKVNDEDSVSISLSEIEQFPDVNDQMASKVG
jgi:hypothetical protein